MTKKTFEELVGDNPDSFDEMDCRPGPSTRSAAQKAELTPPHVRELIAARKAKLTAELREAAE